MFRYSITRSFIDLINLIFIFSLFNDKFIVNQFGENSLRAIFGIFFLVNIVRLYKNLMNKEILRELFPFFIFVFLTYLTMLINVPSWEKIFHNFLLLFGMLTIMLYFINYDEKKTLYFIWIALIISIIILISSTTLSKYTFRKTGGTGDPNEFATQLLSFLFISIYLFRKNKKILFLILSVIAFTYAIFFAGSISSFLMLSVITLIIVLRYLNLTFTKSLLIGTVGLMMIMTVFLLFQENITSLEAVKNVLTRGEKTGTAVNRLHSWYAGLFMFIDKPFFGVGMNQYADFSPIYSKFFLSKDAVAPHNIYIKTLAESGVLVFIALIIFLFDMLTKYFKRIVFSDYFWIYLSVLAYLLMGFTLGLNYNKYLWLSFAVLFNIHMKIHMELNAKDYETKNLV